MTTVTLFDIIAWVETKNVQHAMRFEPSVYARVADQWLPEMVAAQKANSCSQGTARMIYSTSFGAAQIMGFNLYGQGYAGDISTFCWDIRAQETQFDAFVKRKNIVCTPEDLAGIPIVRRHFAQVYNGAPDTYAPLIAQALQHYGFGVS